MSSSLNQNKGHKSASSSQRSCLLQEALRRREEELSRSFQNASPSENSTTIVEDGRGGVGGGSGKARSGRSVRKELASGEIGRPGQEVCPETAVSAGGPFPTTTATTTSRLQFIPFYLLPGARPEVPGISTTIRDKGQSWHFLKCCFFIVIQNYTSFLYFLSICQSFYYLVKMFTF